jgi:hypothetical protein
VGDVEAMRRTLIRGGYQPWDPDEIRGHPRLLCCDRFQDVPPGME